MAFYQNKLLMTLDEIKQKLETYKGSIIEFQNTHYPFDGIIHFSSSIPLTQNSKHSVTISYESDDVYTLVAESYDEEKSLFKIEKYLLEYRSLVCIFERS